LKSDHRIQWALTLDIIDK